MTGGSGKTPDRHALLIGIDYYLPNRLPDNSYYTSLAGCVRDVSHVEAFLRGKLGLPAARITKLSATNTGEPGQTRPPEPPEAWPTYENMVAAFRRVKDAARAGDQVYIHYSGHGGRAPTLVPDRKGAKGLDEALVPTNIGNSTARYLRDVELARIFKDIAGQGVELTVVLDSCHSGGAVRGVGDVAVRGVSAVDTTPRPQESLVAPAEELAATWDTLTAGGTRNVAAGSGWLPEPEGYVLLAACRPSESAYEFAFDGRERNGALTYWLLNSLRTFGAGLTYKSLHDRIVAKVHTQFAQQTPQLQGDGQRLFFGAAQMALQPSVSVLEVDAPNKRLRLATGQALGVTTEAQFAVYPFGTTSFADAAKRQAIATVIQVGATDSWAAITTALSRAPIEPGAPAILINPGAVKLARAVGFARREDLPPGIDASVALAALQAVRQAIAGNPWVAEATAADAVEYQVGMNAAGEYEVWDRAGKAIPNIRPALKANAPRAAEGVVKRLVHLARYHTTEQLDNYDPLSPLAGKLVVELAGVQAEYVRGERPAPRPFGAPGSTPTLESGQWTFLRVANRSAASLNVAVLDLQPDWGISQIYPAGAADWGVQLEPGQELPLLPLRAGLPTGYAEGRDVLKIFAAVGPANFRWLELPPLDQAPTRSPTALRSAGGGAPRPLEQLLSAIAAERPPTRTLTAVADPSEDWVAADVEINVRRAAP
ncbi:MAG: caspase family protein [Chloroflexota bacterium]|nr:caspase family protein [Chloroflexota bacterium]